MAHASRSTAEEAASRLQSLTAASPYQDFHRGTTRNPRPRFSAGNSLARWTARVSSSERACRSVIPGARRPTARSQKLRRRSRDASSVRAAAAVRGIQKFHPFAQGVELRAHDADHREGTVVDREHRPADRVRVAEVSAPEAFTDDDDGIAAPRPLCFAGETTAECRPGAEKGEVVLRDELALGMERLTVRPQVERFGRVGHQGSERAARLAQVDEIRVRQQPRFDRSLPGAGRLDREQAPRLLVREPVEDDGPDHVEDGAVGPDSQAQGQDDHGGQTRL